MERLTLTAGELVRHLKGFGGTSPVTIVGSGPIASIGDDGAGGVLIELVDAAGVVPEPVEEEPEA